MQNYEYIKRILRNFGAQNSGITCKWLAGQFTQKRVTFAPILMMNKDSGRQEIITFFIL